MRELPTRFRQTLAELELLSHGSTQAWNKSAAPAERDTRPSGESRPPHIEYRYRWLRATNDLAREMVESEAKQELKRWKTKAPPPKPEPEHLRNQDIIRRGEGWQAGEVAVAFRLTVRQVMEIRESHGKDPSTGRPAVKDEDPAEQARRLHAQGLSVRQIADYQDATKSTVHRRLKDAA